MGFNSSYSLFMQKHYLCSVLGIGSCCMLFNLTDIMKIPGLSFSLKRALGITAAKQKISRKTGVPMTKQGLERKVGRFVIDAIFGTKKK